MKIHFYIRILAIALTALGADSVSAQQPLAQEPLHATAPALRCHTAIFRPRACTDLDGTMTSIGEAAAKSFQSGDYQKLDASFAEFCTGKNRMPDGTWSFRHFEDGLGRHFAVWSYSKSLLSDITKWQQLSPESSAAQWAESLYWYGAAWSLARPPAGAKRSALNKKAFETRLASAEAALRRAKNNALKCPAVDVRALEIQIDRGTSPKSAMVLFEELRSHYPQFHGLYAAMSRAYFSESKGDPIERDLFASRAADLTKNFEGRGMYARLHSRLHLRRPFGPKQWIGEFVPEWEPLKAAFDDLVKRYPESKAIVADYLDQACRIGDGETYRRLRDSVVDLEAHSLTDSSLDVCDQTHSWKRQR